MRVLFTTNIPSPYRVDFFNELGKKCDLTVLFESRVDKSRHKNWMSNKVLSFNAIFMKGIKKGEADAFCPEIIKYLSLNKFDVIIIGAYHTPSGMLAIQYMKLRNIPFILSSDGGMIKDESYINKKLKTYFISSADRWLSTGKETSKYLEYYGAKKNEIYVYPFTSLKEKEILKEEVNNNEKLRIKSKLNIKEEYVVLSVGRFIYSKGYDILLKACNGIDKNIGIYIVGGVANEGYLKLKNEMDLSNVYFVDFKSKEEIADYYKVADLFVLPTRQDVWGLVINEAMSFGLPVITTNKCVAGVEMITEKTGIIYDVNDIDKLRESIIYMIENRDKFKFEDIINIASKYSIENMAIVHNKIIHKFREELE